MISIFPFGTIDKSFVHGFEAGRIWTLMEENPDKLTGLIFQAENAEMVMRMLEKKGLPLKIKFTDDKRWMTFDDS